MHVTQVLRGFKPKLGLGGSFQLGDEAGQSALPSLGIKQEVIIIGK